MSVPNKCGKKEVKRFGILGEIAESQISCGLFLSLVAQDCAVRRGLGRLIRVCVAQADLHKKSRRRARYIYGQAVR